MDRTPDYGTSFANWRHVLEEGVKPERATIRSAGTRKALTALLALILTTPLASGRDAIQWPPIEPEELALEENPAAPGSSAMIMMKLDIRDDAKGVREIYYRIKIFKDSGREYGDIDIPYEGSEKVTDIAARTIRPDGRVIEFKGAIYDKTLFKSRKERIRAKSFTLPEVQAGSIIEYQYRKKVGKQSEPVGTWFVQEPLFVRRAHLSLKPRLKMWRVVGRRIPNDRLGSYNGRYDTAMNVMLRDLPAFEPDVLMPPEEQLKMRYHITYGPRAYADSHLLWEEVGKSFVEWHTKFMGKPKKLRFIVSQIMSPEDPPLQKARKIYLAIQNRIRNLAYEEKYTKKERKRERLKKRKSAEDVWRYGYGHAHEITNLFTAMCRAAELRSNTVVVSPRDTHFFDKELRDPSQLSDSLTAVSLGNGRHYLDPGTRLAPFGYVSWEKQAVKGFLLGKEDWIRISTPLVDAADSTRSYHLALGLQEDGSASINVKSRYTGQEALHWRDKLFESSGSERVREVHGRLRQHLPAAEIEDVAWSGLDDAGDDVVLTYRFRLPAYGQVQGKRLVVQPLLWAFDSPFSNLGRKLPVQIPHSFTRSQEVKIVPPDGFRLEVIPQLRQL